MSITDHTTSTDTQQRIELPPSVMGCITALAADATLTAGERLTGVLMMIFGWAWYERQESIDPTAIALPKHQWLEVCTQLVHGVPDDAVIGVNLGLSFMNSGPSAYDERA